MKRLDLRWENILVIHKIPKDLLPGYIKNYYTVTKKVVFKSLSKYISVTKRQFI